MRLVVEVGDTLRTVLVQESGPLYRVSLNGHTHVIDVRRISGHTLSLLFEGDSHVPPGRSVEATLFPGGAPNTLDVHVAGHLVPVRLHHGIASVRTREVGSAAGGGPEKVVAPMPGKVTRVLVNDGDEVAHRQGLIVVEAMKMENELKASRAGRIRDVSVAQGQSVEAGAVLMILE